MSIVPLQCMERHKSKLKKVYENGHRECYVIRICRAGFVRGDARINQQGVVLQTRSIDPRHIFVYLGDFNGTNAFVPGSGEPPARWTPALMRRMKDLLGSQDYSQDPRVATVEGRR